MGLSSFCSIFRRFPAFGIMPPVLPISERDVIRNCSTIAKQERINVRLSTTLIESLKGGTIIGTAACAGGLGLGAPGIIVGGIAGIIYAYKRGKRFESLVSILLSMSTEDTRKLYQDILKILNTLGITTAAQFTDVVVRKGVGYWDIVRGLQKFAEELGTQESSS